MDNRHKDIKTGNRTRNIIIKIISIILIIPPLLSSCLKEEADGQPVKVSRTILFYMAGDNSLAEEISEKTDALAAACNLEEGCHLLVYQNRGSEYPPRLVEICKNKVEVLMEYTDRKVTFSQDLTRVINDMVLLRPGSDYGLVLFSHTYGWLPAGSYTSPTRAGVGAIDETTKFELKDFARIIPAGQFRFIIFESGLMAGIEVAFELKDKTEFILASSAEVPSPGFVPVYGKMLERLYKYTPELSGFASDYYEYCNRQAGDTRPVTVSVISTAGIAPFKSFITQVEKDNVKHWEWVEREKIQHFDRRKSEHLFYDLEGYIRSIGSQQDINRLAGLLDGVVLYKAATHSFLPDEPFGYDINSHCGLTVYIPSTKYPYLNTQRKLLLLFSEYQEQ